MFISHLTEVKKTDVSENCTIGNPFFTKGNGCYISLSLIILGGYNLRAKKKNTIYYTQNKNSNINLLITQYLPGPMLGTQG